MHFFLKWMRSVAGGIVLLAFGIVCYYALYIQESGEWFTVRGQKIYIVFGHTHGGDVLNYAIVRSWPANEPDRILTDTRSTLGPIPIRLCRNNGGWRLPAATNGQVYVYFGEELRTMRVDMDEHSDTQGIGNCQTIQDVWDFFSQYRVD
jgi:hypothetical protein